MWKLYETALQSVRNEGVYYAERRMMVGKKRHTTERGKTIFNKHGTENILLMRSVRTLSVMLYYRLLYDNHLREM